MNMPHVRFFGGNYKNSIFRFSGDLIFYRSRDGLTILGGGEKKTLKVFLGFFFLFFFYYGINFFFLIFLKIKNGSFLFFYGLCM